MSPWYHCSNPNKLIYNYIYFFQLGNHDRKRIANRIGANYVDVCNMLLLLLPGTPTTYQGEELGLEGIHLTYEQTQDPYGKNAGPVSFIPSTCNNDNNIRRVRIVLIGLLLSSCLTY